MFAVSGVGVHGGKPCRVSVRLPDEGGIRFLLQGRTLHASSRNLADTWLCNTLEADGLRVRTVEHLLSALLALGIRHAEIRVEGDEIPILDGSAHTFTCALLPFSKVQVPTRALSAPLRVEDGDRFAALVPAESFSVDVRLNLAHPLVQNQRYVGVPLGERYPADIAWARTFGFTASWDEMKQRGLALGSSVDNTVGLTPDGLATGCALHSPDEPVRHKVLDALGDMALWAYLPCARYEAYNAGHALNARLGRLLDESTA